jgi:ribulose-phosphate 3-epimerase
VAGLAVSPRTEVARVRPFLAELGIIMIMTVEPGFGGQRFLAGAAPKIAEARSLFADRPDGLVHVDGGVSAETAPIVGRYGGQVCVVGSALFQRGRDTAREVDEVRRGAGSQASRAVAAT